MAKSKCKLPEWGEEDVRRFFSRFEMCCDLNAWVTDKDKVGQLVPLLSDKVFDFVCGLSETDRAKYDTVKQKLLLQYEDTELEVTYADRFGARKIKRGEDLSTLLLDLKRLVKKGFPAFNEADQARLVYNQFMKSLSPGARKHVLLNPPKEEGETTMALCDQVLAQARLIDQIEKKPVEESNSSPSQVASVNAPTRIEEQMGQMLAAMNDLTKVVHEGLTTPTVSRIQPAGIPNRQSTGAGRGGFRGQCYNCDEWGHAARNCPNPRRRTRNPHCGVCGNTGHNDRDCALARRQSRSVCNICGNAGHPAEQCAMRGRLPPLN